MAQQREQRRESQESHLLVRHAFDLARALRVRKLLVLANEFRDVRVIEKHRQAEGIIWLVRGAPKLPDPLSDKDAVVRIPEVSLTRMSQIHVGLFIAALNEHLGLDETVLCLSGVAGSERLDTLLIANPRRDFPWFRGQSAPRVRSIIGPEVFARLVSIALRFAREGREGRSIGTTFVLGDPGQMAPYLRPLILNPCEGHPRRQRNIQNPEFVETLREYTAMDGAVVVNPKGVVESAGTYLDAPASTSRVRPGLGARHAAAAAITVHTEAVAIVISASSGMVTVFHGGEAILELERT
jgi:diadenylate cyclase